MKNITFIVLCVKIELYQRTIYKCSFIFLMVLVIFFYFSTSTQIITLHRSSTFFLTNASFFNLFIQMHSNVARIFPRYSFLSLQFSCIFFPKFYLIDSIWIYVHIDRIHSFLSPIIFNTNIIAFISFPSTWLSRVIVRSLYYIRVLNTTCTRTIKFPTQHFHTPFSRIKKSYTHTQLNDLALTNHP